MDRITAMQVFADVASTGSFTATADRLEMSRAMVTRYVAAMERWLGARLLQRTTRRVTLTDAGEQCLRRCLQMLDIAAEVVDETAPSDGTLRGQLRLACSVSFGAAQLAAALGDFLALHPHLKVDLDAGEGTLNLVASRIDLAIRISSDPDPALIARPLAACESVLVAAPDYLRRAGRPVHPSGLAAHACLGHATYGRSRWRFSSGGESVEVPVTTRLTANDAVVLLAGAEHIVQQEGCAFVGRQLLQHHEQGDGQVACQFRARIGGRRDLRAQPGLGQPGSAVGLALGARRAQPVHAQARGGGDEPGLRRLDALGARGLPAQPDVLHRVLGVGARAQHPVGDRTQPCTVVLEHGGMDVLGGAGRGHRRGRGEIGCHALKTNGEPGL